ARDRADPARGGLAPAPRPDRTGAAIETGSTGRLAAPAGGRSSVRPSRAKDPLGQARAMALCCAPVPERRNAMPAYSLTVNGESRRVEGEEDMPLLWGLRDLRVLTGTRYGCGVALCRACTVHVDGEAVPACRTP